MGATGTSPPLRFARAGTSVPEPPGPLVSRSRLLGRFTGNNRIVTIVAPAGYGKTVLAADLVRRAEQPVAWLDLGGTSGPDAAPTGVDVDLAALEDSDRPMLLVADGAGPETSRLVLDRLARIVEDPARRARVVVTSRGQPSLPTERWRARGWLAEIREDELALVADEAIELVRRSGDLLSSDEAIVAVNRRVGGWPSGLQLLVAAATDVGAPLGRFRPLPDGAERRRSAGTGLSGHPTDRLTGRERSLLVLLPTHLTYAEMAHRHYVSVNTVKSNMKSLYRKLGVSSRSAAVAVARSSGLLPADGND